MDGTGGGEVGDPLACSGAGAGVKSGSPLHAVRTITSIEPANKKVSHAVKLGAVKRGNTIKKHFRAYRIRRCHVVIRPHPNPPPKGEGTNKRPRSPLGMTSRLCPLKRGDSSLHTCLSR